MALYLLSRATMIGTVRFHFVLFLAAIVLIWLRAGMAAEPSVLRVDVVCRDLPVSVNASWNHYFDSDQDETKKADALAANVSGVDSELAMRIIHDREFLLEKPRTWDEFRTQILKIEGKYGGNIAYIVLGKFGRMNATRLGYYDPEVCEFEIRG